VAVLHYSFILCCHPNLGDSPENEMCGWFDGRRVPLRGNFASTCARDFAAASFGQARWVNSLRDPDYANAPNR